MANMDCPVCEIMFSEPCELRAKLEEIEAKSTYIDPSKMTREELIKQNKKLREIQLGQIKVIWSHRIELRELRAENLDLKKK